MPGPAKHNAPVLHVDMDGTLAVWNDVPQERLYEKGFYRNLEPHQGVVDALHLIAQQHPDIRIHILSNVISSSPYALKEKNAWLDEHLPFIPNEDRFFPVYGRDDKLEYLQARMEVGKHHFLLDDYTKNLQSWARAGTGVKLKTGINHTHGTWQGAMIRWDLPAEELAGQLVSILQTGPRQPEPAKNITNQSRDPARIGGDTMGRTVDRILESVDLMDYIQQHGYTPYRVGADCYSLKEHDSIRIYPKENKYFHNSISGDRRNVINFCEWYYGISNAEAIKKLATELNDKPSYMRERQTAKPVQQEKKPFKLPDRASGQYKRVFGYLCKERCIDRTTVSDMVKRHYLYQDARGNATFVGYQVDGKAAFCFQRGCGDQPYKRVVSGSDFSTAWRVSNGTDTLFVNEAIIDSMSVMSMLRLHGCDPNRYDYLATCGPSTKPLLQYLQEQPDIKTVYLAYDNDEAGHTFRLKAEQDLRRAGFKGKILEKFPKTKDFNLDLQTMVKNTPEHAQEKAKVPQHTKQTKQTQAIERMVPR